MSAQPFNMAVPRQLWLHLPSGLQSWWFSYINASLREEKCLPVGFSCKLRRHIRRSSLSYAFPFLPTHLSWKKITEMGEQNIKYQLKEYPSLMLQKQLDQKLFCWVRHRNMNSTPSQCFEQWDSYIPTG